MLTFRIICALFIAWAMNWSMGRPEAAPLLDELPEMMLLGPLAGAVVGYFNLAARQGWGFIVALANGIWAGFLSMVLAATLVVLSDASSAISVGRDVDAAFMFAAIGISTAEIVDLMADIKLVVVVLGATCVSGLVTEVIHWALVRLRRQRGVVERNTRRQQRPSMYG